MPTIASSKISYYCDQNCTKKHTKRGGWEAETSGALFVKKSNSPDNIKASSIPTKMNCGSKKKALIGRVIDLVMVPLLLAPTTDNLLFSTSAAAAIPNMEKNNPSPTFCKFVKPKKGKKKGVK